MYRQESLHLVALDNHFNQGFLLLIVRLSILNTLTPLWCFECQNKNLFDTFALINLVFVFLFLLFQVGAWSPTSHVHLQLHGPLACSITWVHQPSSIHHSWHRLVLRFHQLSKTKLRLSISPFLVIDDNLFTKIFNKIFLDSCCLPKHITMCKGYGQVS